MTSQMTPSDKTGCDDDMPLLKRWNESIERAAFIEKKKWWAKWQYYFFDDLHLMTAEESDELVAKYPFLLENINLWQENPPGFFYDMFKMRTKFGSSHMAERFVKFFTREKPFRWTCGRDEENLTEEMHEFFKIVYLFKQTP